MSRLTMNDYKKILMFYKRPISSNRMIVKDDAEKLLANKLCRCIKKVDVNNEQRSIGICTKTIFKQKGYTRGRFKCKGNPSVKFRKMNHMKTIKRRK